MVGLVSDGGGEGGASFTLVLLLLVCQMCETDATMAHATSMSTPRPQRGAEYKEKGCRSSDSQNQQSM